MKLVGMKDDSLVTTSLLVAQEFGKLHRNVVKAIKKLTAQNGAVENMFSEGTYLNKQNHKQPMYYMNRDGFSLLVMGFTGKDAMKFKLEFIDAFNAMEKQIEKKAMYGDYADMIPDNMEQALALALNQQKQLEKQKPIVAYYNKQMDSTGLIKVGLIAQNYGISAVVLNKLLNKYGIQYKQGKNWMLYKKYEGNGYTGQHEYGYNESSVNTTMRWTPKGKKFIYDVLKSHNIVPTNEAKVINTQELF